jgi:hypothetical protein
VDTDLAESISALKEAFTRSRVPHQLGRAAPELIASLKEKLKLPRRYRTFLADHDPLDVEIATPTERVRLLSSAELEKEQIGFALSEDGTRASGPTSSGWRPSWIIIGHSGLLGDPYFLDVSDMDNEGDCPVYTAMSGTEQWQPRLCAASFATFLRILAISLDLARGFDIDDYDVDNERVFREALAPKIREYDPAAVKAGHWT